MTTKELQMAKKTKNSTTQNKQEVHWEDESTFAKDEVSSGTVEDTKAIIKVEVPVEQLIAYIVAKIDYLTDVIETRIPPVQKLK